MKNILFILLTLLPAAGAIAQQQTPKPEIYVYDATDVCYVEAYGEGVVHLFKDSVEVENPCQIEKDYDEQRFLFGAYAEVEGCYPSEWVYCEVIVPPMEGPILPVDPDMGVHVTLTEESVILEPYADPAYFNNLTYVIRLYLDGVEVEYPYMLPRCQEEYIVDATVLITVEGLGYPFVCNRDIVVPALEPISPENKYDLNGDGEVNIADVNAIINYILGN